MSGNSELARRGSLRPAARTPYGGKEGGEEGRGGGVYGGGAGRAYGGSRATVTEVVDWWCLLQEETGRERGSWLQRQQARVLVTDFWRDESSSCRATTSPGGRDWLLSVWV